MIDEKRIIRRLEKMVEKTPRFAGLKKEALLEEIIKMLREEAVNEDIRQRIQRAIGPQDDARAKRIYISGKMTGLEEQEIAENFKEAKRQLCRPDVIPISPTGIDYGDKLAWAEYMRLDEVLIQICDAIYMLSNWQDSPGACHELEYARSLGKPVIYQEDPENVE